MKIHQFFEKAIQGGWKLLHNPSIQEDINSELVVYLDPKLPIIRKLRRYEILLDPLSWQAVGKVEGWDDVVAYVYRPMLYSECYPDPDRDGDIEWRSGIGRRASLEEKLTLEEEAKKLKEGQNGYDPVFEPILKTKGYRDFMHRFIDFLCDGLTLEEALDKATS